MIEIYGLVLEEGWGTSTRAMRLDAIFRKYRFSKAKSTLKKGKITN